MQDEKKGYNNQKTRKEAADTLMLLMLADPETQCTFAALNQSRAQNDMKSICFPTELFFFQLFFPPDFRRKEGRKEGGREGGKEGRKKSRKEPFQCSRLLLLLLLLLVVLLQKNREKHPKLILHPFWKQEYTHATAYICWYEYVCILYIIYIDMLTRLKHGLQCEPRHDLTHMDFAKFLHLWQLKDHMEKYELDPQNTASCLEERPF